ncbi:MAG: hypothetical protein JNM39_05785 [Bdellovibrionaceae bacterium]|nr:hypothetical protein [Pseudobdellovibrionaceae bacterium]
MKFALSIVGLLVVGAVNSFAAGGKPQMGPNPTREQFNFVFDRSGVNDPKVNYNGLVGSFDRSRGYLQDVTSEISRLRGLAEWQNSNINPQPPRLAKARLVEGGIAISPIFPDMPTWSSQGIQDSDIVRLRKMIEHLAKTYPDKKDEIIELTKHLSQVEPSNSFTYLSAGAKRERIATQIRAFAALANELDAKMGFNSFESATVNHNGKNIIIKKDADGLYTVDQDGRRIREVKFEIINQTKSKPAPFPAKNIVRRSGGGGTVVSLSVAAFLGLVINQSMVGDGEAAEARKAQPSAMHQPYLSLPAVGPAAAK